MTDGRSEDARLQEGGWHVPGPGGDPDVPPLTEDEIDALIDEALGEEIADESRPDSV